MFGLISRRRHERELARRDGDYALLLEDFKDRIRELSGTRNELAGLREDLQDARITHGNLVRREQELITTIHEKDRHIRRLSDTLDIVREVLYEAGVDGVGQPEAEDVSPEEAGSHRC